MNFHQLHIFYTVSERGSFSAAAQTLHMTQPAVTMQVQALEDYFGTKLFNRSTKKIVLSEAGHTLMPYALRSIQLMRETDQAMSAFTHMLEGRLQLGASLTIGEYVLPRLLGPFGKQYPNISIMMKVMNTSQIMEEILKHQLNFGLIEAPVTHPDMEIEPVMGDELKLIVPYDHPLAEQQEVTLEQVLQHPFVLREQGSGTRRVMEEQLFSKGLDPGTMKIVMELGSTGAVKSAVEAGLGITIISTSSVKHEVALGLLKIVNISDASFKRQFYAIHLKSTLLPISAVTFLTYLREHSNEI
ncbi:MULTISPECIES: selenium metabolism-associated LysR family transcriptional regulator [Paenibacillus]|uniref:selenium metabolism-associated LysR family transcriptional regulator n=1 Tax=Paenibacillus TaxID=44249 RepID=UPI0004F84D55|nr:selenium metabolism-associated LysR family transcriptional regulator [Paenibacillus odorifer]AIQ73959.1 LysR family transcriptional regulator [Paenibacillus odorifer]OMC94506.1 LysR family transcriptional regulator [Paenibacillus odorifer]OME27551.1 LysR family transcriptional regulator [Paenibacillus odorifer]OME49119.1 LysR family transcriptional regulator [Paenibacillus odorifer]OME49477.1 LysR family transcriptional regulator [Paenibacillus odorifer]